MRGRRKKTDQKVGKSNVESLKVTKSESRKVIVGASGRSPVGMGVVVKCRGAS